MTEAQRLRRIRQRLELAPHGMEAVFSNGDWLLLTTNRPNPDDPLATFAPDVDPDVAAFLAACADDMAFLLQLVDRAVRKLREAAEAQPRSKSPDYAAEAAMKCNDPAFVTFLCQRHGLSDPENVDAIQATQRRALGVGSRRELNESDQAAARWRDLRTEFQNWSNGVG